jgi:hypothetical protein
MEAYRKLDKAVPVLDGLPIPADTRVRHDKVDKTGVVTLRYRSKLFHICIGRAHSGRRILMLVCNLDVRIIAEDGELLRHLTLDTTKNYQAKGRGTL